jgi:hypothetical protein
MPALPVNSGTLSLTFEAAARTPSTCRAYLLCWGATPMMEVVAMRKLKIFAVAVPLFALSVLTPLVAQEYGRG